MPLEVLDYLENSEEHKGFGSTLGELQGLILTGKHTRNTTHAYYGGHEMKAKGEAWTRGDYHLKKDCTGKGKGNGRSQNRIIVRMTNGDQLQEDWAAVWRHDDRILRLGKGFFDRAKTMRDYYVNAK